MLCRTWTTSTHFLLLAPLLRQLCWNKERHWECRKILILSNISKWWKVRSWQTVGFPSTKPRAKGSFSCSLLDEKASEAFFCLQKAISLFLAAATSGVEKSSRLLYMAGSSSKDFKGFKFPETEVQQCYDRSNGKIFRSTFFLLYKARKPKNLQKPKTDCSLSNTLLRQQAKCYLKCSKEIFSKELQPPSKKNHLALHEMCHLFLVLFFAQI